jgi:hypothetical protein
VDRGVLDENVFNSKLTSALIEPLVKAHRSFCFTVLAATHSRGPSISHHSSAASDRVLLLFEPVVRSKLKKHYVQLHSGLKDTVEAPPNHVTSPCNEHWSVAKRALLQVHLAKHTSTATSPSKFCSSPTAGAQQTTMSLVVFQMNCISVTEVERVYGFEVRSVHDLSS